jgi:hypothetical protein
MKLYLGDISRASYRQDFLDTLYIDIFTDNIFDFIESLEQGKENENSSVSQSFYWRHPFVCDRHLFWCAIAICSTKELSKRPHGLHLLRRKFDGLLGLWEHLLQSYWHDEDRGVRHRFRAKKCESSSLMDFICSEKFTLHKLASVELTGNLSGRGQRVNLSRHLKSEFTHMNVESLSSRAKGCM